MRVRWVPRETPLPPAAVTADGEPARRLARRLLERGIGNLEGVVADRRIVVIGPDLPWVDGCAYLGRDPRCPSLFLPTALRPDVALELFERALARRFSNLERPLAVLPESARVVPLGSARTLARGALDAWLGEG